MMFVFQKITLTYKNIIRGVLKMNKIRILIKNIRLLSKIKLWEMEYELKKNIFDDICYEVNDEFEPELNI